jgi:hypothetical protein
MSKRAVLMMFAGMLLLAALFVWICIVPKPLEPTLPEIGPGAPQHHATANTDLQAD